MLVATCAIFPIPLKEAAQEVISVLAGNKLLPIYGVETGEKKVAISFDATWGNTRTPKILQILEERGLKSTFFLTNIWLKEYPELGREIKEKGHEIGLHSANHPNLTTLPVAKIKEELLNNAQLIKEVTGFEPVLFRPPFGAYNNTVISTARELGYRDQHGKRTRLHSHSMERGFAGLAESFSRWHLSTGDEKNPPRGDNPVP